MSMNPGRLPDLEAGDRLDVTSELQVTLDCVRPEPRCAGRPYEYDVDLRGKARPRARRRSHGRRQGRAPDSARSSHVCLGRYPHREHHCVITFTDGGMRVGQQGPPCPPAECRINVVLSAHNANAQDGQLLAIGGTPPSGEISQDRGRVNAIVYRPADQPRPKPETTRKTSGRAAFRSTRSSGSSSRSV